MLEISRLRTVYVTEYVFANDITLVGNNENLQSNVNT